MVKRFVCVVLASAALVIGGGTLFAQSQCPAVTSVQFPVDPSMFRLMQDFAVPSPRHQGRFHTGEDWYGGRGTSLGTEVRAIAAGRVTFSSPNGWGRDGGVIILEHRMPDGSIAYSQYGHIAEGNGVVFPATLSCVNGGDVIARVGDARPAPHLHFEIRVQNPDTPGAGYTWDDPANSGLRRPSKFLLNWQTWLSEGANGRSPVAWTADLADESAPNAPPVTMRGGDMIVLDGDRVINLSYDGRVLWRVNLDQAAVGVIPFADAAAVIYASGSVRQINPDGSLGESWALGTAVDSAPMHVDGRGLLLFHTPDNGLIAADEAARSVAWRITDVSAVRRYAFARDIGGVVTDDNRVITFGYEGTLVDEARLREAGALFGSAESDLLAYTRGGFWSITPAGEWVMIHSSVPPGGESAAIWRETDVFYLFDGSALRGYSVDGSARWQVDLPGWAGDVHMSASPARDFLILTSSYGEIAVVRTSDGAVCNTAQIYGDRRSRVWHELGEDQVLRVYVADQVLGLDWGRFLLGCG